MNVTAVCMPFSYAQSMGDRKEAQYCVAFPRGCPCMSARLRAAENTNGGME